MYVSYSACVWPGVGGSGAPSCGQYSNASGYLIWHWAQVFTACRSYRVAGGGSILDEPQILDEGLLLDEALASQERGARVLDEVDPHRALDVAHQEAAARRPWIAEQPVAVVAQLVGEQEPERRAQLFAHARRFRVVATPLGEPPHRHHRLRARPDRRRVRRHQRREAVRPGEIGLLVDDRFSVGELGPPGESGEAFAEVARPVAARAVGQEVPRLVDGLARPVVFAVEEARGKRIVGAVGEPLDRAPESGRDARIRGELVQPGERERGLAGEVQKLRPLVARGGRRLIQVTEIAVRFLHEEEKVAEPARPREELRVARRALVLDGGGERERRGAEVDHRRRRRVADAGEADRVASGGRAADEKQDRAARGVGVARVAGGAGELREIERGAGVARQ